MGSGPLQHSGSCKEANTSDIWQLGYGGILRGGHATTKPTFAVLEGRQWGRTVTQFQCNLRGVMSVFSPKSFLARLLAGESLGKGTLTGFSTLNNAIYPRALGIQKAFEVHCCLEDKNAL